MNTALKYSFFLLAAVIVLVFGAFFLGRHFSARTSGIAVDTSRESVVTRVEALNRLETASFTIEKVIEAGTQGNKFQEILYGDRILLIAHGKVIAGVDLSQVDANQVKVNGTSVTMTLPAPSIFSASLENSQTKVFDRKLGLLSRGNQDLESLARTGAEASISQAACAGGILTDASNNAKARLTDLFKGLGFTDVTISIPTGTCDAG